MRCYIPDSRFQPGFRLTQYSSLQKLGAKQLLLKIIIELLQDIVSKFPRIIMRNITFLRYDYPCV